MDRRKIKILMLSAEITPIAKVGGLGDVMDALPKALSGLSADIKIFIPFYGLVDKKKYRAVRIISRLKAPVGGKKEIFNVWQTNLPGTLLPVYLVKHRYFSSWDIYNSDRILMGDKYSRGISDIRRFAFFTRACLIASKALNFKPDIIHAHDWHTALAGDIIKGGKDDFFKNTKVVYTIHNLANQGIASPKIIGFSKIDPNLPIIKADAKNGDINFMVQGILSSDAITTVSPTYAKEVLTHYEGAGLDKILKKRKKDLYGILNGIDTDFFNPATDKLIRKRYSLKSLAQKEKNKLALQKMLNLPQNKKIAVVGLISRLVWQKGIELITKKFARLNCQFVFLGEGEKKYENHLKELAKKYPHQFSAQIKFDEKLAHQIYAGSDIFLMPSRFEPCGLGQMISMRYGTVPLVRKTGGLVDTVAPLIRGVRGINKPAGFVFQNFNSNVLYNKLKSALDIFYTNPKLWRQLQINGMKKDFSWDKSAKEYLKLYKRLVK